MICHSGKFVFTHQGKCGGSSITQSFKEIFPEAFRARFHDINGPHTTLTDQLEYLEKTGHDPSTYFKFSSVRNPWDRQVSWYWHWKQYVDQDKTSDSKTPENLPESFNKWLIESPGHCLTWSDMDKFDYIMKLEDIETGFKYVCEKLNIHPRRLLHINHNTWRPATKGYRDYYTQETINMVAKKNNDIIEKFNYTF
jgi:hypothetical protein